MSRFKKYKIFLFFLVFTVVALAQNPPQIVVEGNQLFCGEAPMPIVTNISINTGTEELENVFIQISQGYTQGQDQLVLTGEHPNISASWSANEGILTLSGEATADAYELAVADVVFQTTQTNFTEDKVFSINLGNANYLPSTGHYYFYVADVGVSWGEAKDDAEELTYFGLQGYLVTITTEEEAQLAGQQSPGTGWIGGSDRINEGTWIWETGPEEGEIFWNGSVNGNSPDGAFSFWNTGEPNNCCGGEDYAHITAPNIGIEGSWNDLPNTGALDPNSDYHPQGYIVEFGGLPGEPELSISGSTMIITPKLEIITESICDSGDVIVEVSSNTDEVVWYETPSSTEELFTGLVYETQLDETTTFWLSARLDGCDGGPRIPVTVTVYDSPVANNITITQCDDETADGFTIFNLSNYVNEILNGNLDDDFPNLAVTFFEDENLQNTLGNSYYENLTNPKIVYARVENTLTLCESVSEIQLQVNTNLPTSASLEVCDDVVVDGFAFFDLRQADSQFLNGLFINASVSYYETYDDALLEVNGLPDNYFNTVAYNHNIFARINTELGCYSINNLELTVKDIPNIDQFEEVYYCLNNFPEPIILNGGVIDDLPNNYYYNWSTNETTINIEVNEIGTYTVIVTEPEACSNERTVRVLPSSIATVETIDVTDLSDINTITVAVSGDGDYVFALDDENGPYQESNLFQDVTAGIHTVYVKDVKNNCGVVAEQISVLGYPKFFTPNGDSVNDRWELKGFSSKFPITATVKIIDRYGKLITILNSDNPNWDGSFNGSLLPSSDYWFIANFEDGRIIKGHFALKR